jgi:hypothetical protein
VTQKIIRQTALTNVLPGVSLSPAQLIIVLRPSGRSPQKIGLNSFKAVLAVLKNATDVDFKLRVTSSGLNVFKVPTPDF